MRCLEADVSDRFVIGPCSGSPTYSGVFRRLGPFWGPLHSWEQARKPINDDRAH